MILFLIPAAMLLLAMADMPSGYYVFMRIVVCLACAVVAYGSYKREDSLNSSAILFGLMAKRKQSQSCCWLMTRKHS